MIARDLKKEDTFTIVDKSFAGSAVFEVVLPVGQQVKLCVEDFDELRVVGVGLVVKMIDFDIQLYEDEQEEEIIQDDLYVIPVNTRVSVV